MSAIARFLDVPKADGVSCIPARLLRQCERQLVRNQTFVSCKVRTRASLGRSGGAVHGANSNKVRRRPRAPQLPEQGDDSGTENDGSPNGYTTEEELKASRTEVDSLRYSAPEGERSSDYVVALVPISDKAGEQTDCKMVDSIQVNVIQTVTISPGAPDEKKSCSFSGGGILVGVENVPLDTARDCSLLADTPLCVEVHASVSGVNLEADAMTKELLAEQAAEVADKAERAATCETEVHALQQSEGEPPTSLELSDVSGEGAGQVAVVPKIVETMSVADKVVELGQQVVSQVAEYLPDPVVKQAGQVVDQVSQTAEQMVEQVTTTAIQMTEQVTSRVADLLSFDNEEDNDSDDEFEAFKTADSAEFRGTMGLENFSVLQEDEGIVAVLHNFYVYMMKKPFPEFVLGMFAAPILNSLIFTLLYLPEFEGLALDDTARDYFTMKGAAEVSGGSYFLQLSWSTFFQVFMFSLSLSTGLQPELAPLTPYTLVVANVNALVSQILFVFLSGAVFARLSQPSQPVRCSSVALVCPPMQRRRKQEAKYKVLMVRYVLAGPQPSELVDVKIDLAYKFNTSTRTGTYFRGMQSLKLVRPEIAYQTLGMLVRHVIDESSPLYGRSPEMLSKEDGIFEFSVVALERSSMQSIFHVQHYCVADDHVVWDAEFEDMILINKKNKRIVDHSKLSCWRPVKPTS